MEEPDADIEMEQLRLASYSDTVIIHYTQFTFNFEFSQQVPPEGKKTNNPICLGRIVMSPQHAKLFNKILTNTLEEYEKKISEISLKV
jgi:hypothetical protein